MNPTVNYAALDARVARKIERGAERLGRFNAVRDWYELRRGMFRIVYKTTEESIVALCSEGIAREREANLALEKYAPKEWVN